MGRILTALGFVVAVLGPIIQAASGLALPSLAQKILAVAGIVVFLAGVAHDALAKWQAGQQDTALKLAGKRPC